ncbi:hypothetical protein EVAR_22699_1 [Eumeta japonica]|uniref:Uncharacterized protein n=1 Tax=Eumeta variegata TaxID=151549 RepID=A0A4C1US99_EUMVA|nr:hypothetical protein EVAR_22699_1 [Eumeta japonica]
MSVTIPVDGARGQLTRTRKVAGARAITSGPAHKPRFVDRQPLPGLVVTLACAYLARRSRSFAVWGCGKSFFGPARRRLARALLNEPSVRAVGGSDCRSVYGVDCYRRTVLSRRA